jgi:hypothetical protein
VRILRFTAVPVAYIEFLNTTTVMLSLHYIHMATMFFMCDLLYKLLFQSSYTVCLLSSSRVCHIHHYGRNYPERRLMYFVNKSARYLMCYAKRKDRDFVLPLGNLITGQ